jgi:hypothetical protein
VKAPKTESYRNREELREVDSSGLGQGPVTALLFHKQVAASFRFQTVHGSTSSDIHNIGLSLDSLHNIPTLGICLRGSG